MKAVIVDIEGKYAVALDKKGSFIKINNNGKFKVGHEVEVPAASLSSHLLMKAATVAAAVLLTVSLGYGGYSYYQPYSYVDVDINPSIELTVNKYDRVIRAEGINSDGEKLLAQDKLANKSLGDAVDSILKGAAGSGYIKEDSRNAVMFTVSSVDDKKIEQIEYKVKEIASEKVDAISDNTDVLVEKVTSKKHDDAMQLGISPGKLALIEKLIDVKPEVKVDDYKDKSVKEIVKTIVDNKKLEAEDVKEEKKQDSKSLKSTDEEEKSNPVKEESAVSPKDAAKQSIIKQEDKPKDTKSPSSIKKDNGNKKRTEAKSIDEYIKKEVPEQVEETGKDDDKDEEESEDVKQNKKGSGKSEETSRNGRGSDKSRKDSNSSKK